MSRAAAQASSTAAVPYFFIRESTPRMRRMPVSPCRSYSSLGACMCCAPQELRRAQGHFLWVIFFLDAIAAALLAQMLAEKLVGVGMQDAHVQRVPLHLHGTPDPSWR